MTGVAPIACDQLAARLATEANALTSQTASSNSTPAVVPASADAVKELQIDLAPASLGAVSVKMRLAQGQLSVVMEVAKPSTLKAIESERGAIADRLGTNAQSVEILMAKPDAANQTSAESDHARDQQPGSRENGQSDPNQPSQGDERQPSGRENAANRWSRPAAAQPTPSGRGFGDLVV
jgi:chemotaxis protein MotD